MAFMEDIFRQEQRCWHVSQVSSCFGHCPTAGLSNAVVIRIFIIDPLRKHFSAVIPRFCDENVYAVGLITLNYEIPPNAVIARRLPTKQSQTRDIDCFASLAMTILN